MSGLAKIIPIRPEVIKPVTCFECVHGYMGRDGVICEITMTLLMDESSAQSCEAFERENASA